MKRIKPYSKYIFLFFYFLVCLIICYTVSRNDTYVNYGFSYAIRRGEVPYRDFNIIITPLAPLLYSIFLLVNKSIFCYYVGQSLLLTGLSFFIFKLLGNNKGFLFLLIMIIPFPIALCSCLFPGYNFLLFLLFIILIYLEKEKKNDFLIGIILGAIFCTKQTMGVVLALPSIYYLLKNRKRFFKRLRGGVIPIIILLSYLIITKSLKQFIDLCFLGLFDFKSNSYVSTFYLILLLIFISISIIKIIKDKKNIINYYILIFSLIAVPLIDFYHTSYFILVAILGILLDYKIKIEKNIAGYVVLLMIVISGSWTFVETKYINNIKIASFHNFPLTVASSEYFKMINDLSYYTNKLDKKVIYMMCGSENYLLKIMNDKEIDYFDLPNYGNYGYNGVNKLLKKVEKTKGYYVLDKKITTDNLMQQYIIEVAKYIKNKGKKIKTIGNYEIYLKE